MKPHILFEEIQAAGNRKIQQFFKVTATIFLLALVVNLFIQRGAPSDYTTLLFAGVLLFALAAIFTSIRMVTQIRQDGIYVRYPPFQPSFVRFGWSDIRHAYIRKYNALPEYNGWGIKRGRSGRSYTAGGNIGLQLELYDGTRILIGTNRPADLEQVLASILD